MDPTLATLLIAVFPVLTTGLIQLFIFRLNSKDTKKRTHSETVLNEATAIQKLQEAFSALLDELDDERAWSRELEEVVTDVYAQLAEAGIEPRRKLRRKEVVLAAIRKE